VVRVLDRRKVLVLKPVLLGLELQADHRTDHGVFGFGR